MSRMTGSYGAFQHSTWQSSSWPLEVAFRDCLWTGPPPPQPVTLRSRAGVNNLLARGATGPRGKRCSRGHVRGRVLGEWDESRGRLSGLCDVVGGSLRRRGASLVAVNWPWPARLADLRRPASPVSSGLLWLGHDQLTSSHQKADTPTDQMHGRPSGRDRYLLLLAEDIRSGISGNPTPLGDLAEQRGGASPREGAVARRLCDGARRCGRCSTR
jgi:hypothetical protein